MPLNKKNIIVFTGLFLIAFSIVLFWWIFKDPYKELTERIPGMDNRPKMEIRSDTVIIGEYLDTLAEFDEFVAGEWPRF